MPNNILISGRPGSGKTTLIVRLVKRLSGEGFKTAGFVTEEIKEGPRRKGFEVRDLQGETAVLAHVDFPGPPRVSKYGVDLEAFEKVALKALETGRKKADLLVVDEIGRMEIASPFFRSVLLELMSLPVPLLATVHQAKDPFTTALLERDDVSVYDISRGARENLMEVIDGSLRGILADRNITREPEGGMRS